VVHRRKHDRVNRGTGPVVLSGALTFDALGNAAEVLVQPPGPSKRSTMFRRPATLWALVIALAVLLALAYLALRWGPGPVRYHGSR